MQKLQEVNATAGSDPSYPRIDRTGGEGKKFTHVRDD